jgi:hypothetical protein
MSLKQKIIDGFLEEMGISKDSFEKMTHLSESLMKKIKVHETDEYIVIDIDIKKLHIKIDK